MADRATMKDVASLAGVSLSTVSHTLNNKGAISDETRARVLAAARQLGYQPRVPIATGVAKLTSVTMLVKRDPDERAPNPFHYYVMKGIEEQARQLGLELKLASIDVDRNSRALEVPAALDDRRSDGFLVVGAVIEEPDAFLERVGERPLVFVNGYLAHAPCDRIGIENRAGAYDATRHLIAQGHRRIGFVGGGRGVHPSIAERREGYQQALADHGLGEPVTADSIVLLPEYAREPTREMLERHPDLSAVVAASDNVAMGVMKAAQDLGIAIPDGLSLVGFDNVPTTEHLTPPLTTMDIDKAFMGVLGVRQLYDRPTFPERPPVTILVRPELVVRASVRRWDEGKGG